MRKKLNRKSKNLLVMIGIIMCWIIVSCTSARDNYVNTSANTAVADESTSPPTKALAPVTIQVTALLSTPTETMTPETPTLVPTPSPILTPTLGFNSIFIQVSIEETGWLNFINSLSENIGGVLSPDHSLFAWAEIEKTYVVNVNTGEQRWLFEKPLAPRNGTKALVFSPNGSLLANGGAEEIVYVWSLETGELMYEFPLTRSVQYLQFSNDGNVLVAGGGGTGDVGGSKIIVWNLSTATSIEYPEEEWLGGIALSPNSKMIAVNSSGLVKLWDIQSGEISQLPFDTNGERSFENLVAFSPDGKQLIAQVDDRLRIWNLESNQEVEVEDASGLTVDLFPFQFKFSPNGYFLVWDGITKVTLWDSLGKVAGILESEVSISHIELTPDGLFLITFTVDGQVHAWKLPTP